MGFTQGVSCPRCKKVTISPSRGFVESILPGSSKKFLTRCQEDDCQVHILVTVAVSKATVTSEEVEVDHD